MEEITSNNDYSIYINIGMFIVAILSMGITAWSTVHMVRKSVDEEKKENLNWKSKKDTTDTEQNKDIKKNSDDIKKNAEDVKAQELKLQQEIKKREELEKRTQKEINEIKEIIQSNRENLKEEIIKAIDNIGPQLKEQKKEIIDHINTAIAHNKELNDKEIKNIWNELDKKSTKRVKK